MNTQEGGREMESDTLTLSPSLIFYLLRQTSSWNQIIVVPLVPQLTPFPSPSCPLPSHAHNIQEIHITSHDHEIFRTLCLSQTDSNCPKGATNREVSLCLICAAMWCAATGICTLFFRAVVCSTAVRKPCSGGCEP